jgi:hypothetical protein
MAEPVQPSNLDRLLTAVRNLIRAELPSYTYCGLYEYTIQAVNSGTGAVDLSPTDTTIPLPLLSAIPLKPSLLGEMVQATVGSLALVEFVNSDPTRPEVVSIGATIFEGTIDATQTLNIGPSGKVNLGAAQSPVSRINDTCVIYFDASVPLVLTGVLTTPPATPFGTFAGTMVIGPSPGVPSPCTGIIGSGSTKVFA